MDGELSTTVLQRGLHRAVWLAHRLRRAIWFVTRPNSTGVHAVPITAEGKIVMVMLSYADGWRLPGGGRKAGEAATDAILREMSEEIGLVSHRSIEKLGDFDYRPDFKRSHDRLFIVRGVVHEPRWSLEIRAVRAFDPQSLPIDMSPVARRMLAMAQEALPEES